MEHPISHITLVVKDIQKSSRIVIEALGGVEIYDSGNKSHSVSPERFFDIRGLWFVLMEGTPLKEKTYNHIAFTIDKNNMQTAVEKIKNLNLEIVNLRPRVDGEGESIYFYDYDNHLFELHTGTLEERLKKYRELESQNK